ncbi:MAG TPA: T9SS type A sorting domain-containing protein [Candidatus Kryptonia bacterium]
MQNRIVSARSISLIVVATLWSASAFGWGQDGHRIINSSFTKHFPLDTSWVARFTQYYADHASDADNRKSSDPSESPRHFIDIDAYAEFHSSWFPHDIDSLIAEYGSSTVTTNGTLPWAIKADYDSLVAFLKSGDTVSANRVIADLGHYIGDACQPLHCTENYNRNGIHSPYESTMLHDYLSEITISPDTSRYIPDVLDFAFRVIYASNSKAQVIIDADDQAGGKSARQNSPTTYYQTLWSLLDTMTIGQLQTASVSLASLVYSAMVDASPATAVHQSNPSTFMISEAYPNPFNPTTNIDVDVPAGTGTANVSVYASDGRRIQSFSTSLHAGHNILSLNLSGQASGVYFAKIETLYGTERNVRTLKAILIK